MNDALLIELLDAQLPQTQCGLCGHADGCLPYARSMVQTGEAANLCVPGGQPVADALAALLDRMPLPVAASNWPLGADGRPLMALAVIREDECIGCTKCLLACPVDAIVGSAKRMHTVITADCTGCELCLPPCPVDCIDLVMHPQQPEARARSDLQNHWRRRHRAHVQRLQGDAAAPQPATLAAPPAALPPSADGAAPATSFAAPAQTLALAPLRSQIGRLQRQLARNPADAALGAQLAQLQQQLTQLTPAPTEPKSP